jgi:hypothetical protein
VSNKATKFAFEGYGVYGLLCSKLLPTLTELGILGTQTVAFSASSMSSIVALMCAAGYESREIACRLEAIGYDAFVEEHQSCCCRSRKGKALFGTSVDRILRQLLKDKMLDPNTTFAQLAQTTGKSLIISAICIEKCRDSAALTFFSPKLSPDVPVVLAVRAALSIPGMFKPVEIGGFHYIDSHCRYTYPIEIFDNVSVINPIAGPAFGLHLGKNMGIGDASNFSAPVIEADGGRNKKMKVKEVVPQLFSLLQSVSTHAPLSPVEIAHTIGVSAGDIGPFDFALAAPAKKIFIDAIPQTIVNFLSTNGEFPMRRF